ncbi:GntR family transcriptional regulator [Rhizobium rhizosphaerae]|uniref:GntR family transcriptional regulator n=1 Tax=Xaviernesmea rhizosphaerae TaxID=1672749 RepID=A0A1Q9AQF8_9HYPH|nr:GntR family transcriptional regulator [Xaviernesmea rhizosphaerae]OLP57611.1 GntR family transcriptional regulator [Xaviernesmea rhizosphaerae]OQP83953.1 GntR family transcriptional regulator [Xaviernesmea rhizosphaerae]
MMEIAETFARESGEGPLYKRLKTALEEIIRGGSRAGEALRAGAVLPGERVLAAELGLSRVTVRKALSLLEAEGLISRRQGSRTEVGARVEKSLATLTSFSEDIRARGQVPGCLWLFKQMSRPSSAEMMALGIAGTAPVLRMKRVRLADGLPIAVEISAVPARFLASPELVGDSLYEALATRGLMPERAVQRMRARAASADDALHLACEAGAPILSTERRCFLADGQIVEYCETRYKGEVYDFVFELHR